MLTRWPIRLRQVRDELEFLPAALEVEETPAAPAGRAILWSIMMFFSIAVAWAFVGEVNVVATAQGKIIPSGHVKVIQPLEIGVVRRIRVEEGTVVAEGELLVELDPTTTGAEEDRIRNELRAVQLDKARLTELLEGLNERGRSMHRTRADAYPTARALHGAESPMARVGHDNSEAQSTASDQSIQRRILSNQLAEYDARLAALDSEIAQRASELRSVKALAAKFARTVPLITQRAEAMRDLAERKMGSTLDYLELEQERVEQVHDLEAQQHRLLQTRAAMSAVREQRDAVEAEFRHARLMELIEAGRHEVSLTKELAKARQRSRLQQLRAPVAGVVQQLEIHSTGGIVTPAQVLMQIVPTDGNLEVEAWLQNKDIGFVEPGQTAEVKVETFPFTRYGTIDAEILDLSDDAVSDERLGLVYAARVRLSTAVMQVDGRLVDLTPGMAVTVEAKTGTRRLIEFLMTPLVRGITESARER